MKILILLSTYNGSQYIREQLSSILSQDVDGELFVLIRDDGSKDETLQIIKEINDGRIELITGDNIGVPNSFIELLAEAYKYNPDFVALADQDDIWMPGKLRRAVDKLREVTVPALYCTALKLVDNDLRPIGKYIFIDEPSFEASFFNNCATGCTCVFNRKLLDLLYPLPDADKIIMHDWWLYIVAAAFGKVIYDDQALILYRQHGSNNIGMHIGISAIIYRMLKLLNFPVRTSRVTQAHEFARIYQSELPTEKAKYLSELVNCNSSLIARMKFAFLNRPKRRKFNDDVATLVAFLLGR